LSTRTLPSLIVTSATCATAVPKLSCSAMPCADPGGIALPQPDLSATSLSVAVARAFLSSNARRKARGSWPAARASLSIIVSIT